MSVLVERVFRATRRSLGQVPDFRLAPAASASLLSAVEAEIGFELPGDVRDLYLAHDGQHPDGVGFFFGWQFDSLAVALANWRIERGAYGHARSDWLRASLDDRTSVTLEKCRVRACISSPRWFPVSSLDGRTGIYADCDPGPAGVRGQIIVAGNEVPRPEAFADSLGALLAKMETFAERGEVRVGRDADDRVTWGIGARAASIDEHPELFLRPAERASAGSWLASLDSACA